MSTVAERSGDRIVIDPRIQLRIVDKKIAATKDPIRKRNLESVREHLYHECQLDVGGLMSTLAPNSSYKLWMDGEDIGPKGNAAIEDWYNGFVRVRALVLQYALDRVVADDDCVVTEGQMSAVVDGQYANQFFGVECEPNDMFVHTWRQVIFWPVDENGVVTGEDIYLSGQTHPNAWRKLKPEEVPEPWAKMQKLSRELEAA